MWETLTVTDPHTPPPSCLPHSRTRTEHPPIASIPPTPSPNMKLHMDPLTQVLMDPRMDPRMDPLMEVLMEVLLDTRRTPGTIRANSRPLITV